MVVEPLAGHPTYWHRAGQGAREALLVHCSLAHSGAWRGVERVLSEQLKMLALDLPGHGRSADWDGVGDYQDTSVHIAEALLNRETTGPVDLIGHSYGGTIAMRLAQRNPARVRSLTMFEPVFFSAARNHPAYAENTALMNGPFAQAVQDGDRMEAARLFNMLWGRDAAWQSLPLSQREDMARRIHLIPAGKPVTHDDIHGQLAPGALERLDVPVLLMEGARSPALISAVHDALEARLPNVRRHVIDGAGHMAPVTHPIQVGDRILAFLREAGPVVA
ncbi:alpha/beta hydrolase [Aliiroseovarius sediminis]|uniref:alpha/beta fold hydrolase n=1 Tax=Aliiroseovarius sediminis TaxID=2925839 RepID=UPI001F569D3E|nr:alpha/beta hydrolase [Aliiroseovarius sediminis]MCI2395268.1 alpha/beta hydrolase [Aliiroseovarius sediminis]